jgi:hypothetical protein
LICVVSSSVAAAGLLCCLCMQVWTWLLHLCYEQQRPSSSSSSSSSKGVHLVL